MSCKSGDGATHHLACDCREKMLADEIAKWKKEALVARQWIDWCGSGSREDDRKLEDIMRRYNRARAANGGELDG